MHVHSLSHGAAVRSLEAKDAKSATAINQASGTATANKAVGATATQSNPLANLASNLQAVLLGVTQTAQSTTTQALSAYNQNAIL